GERIVDDGVGGVDQLLSTHGDQIRLTGSRTDKENLSFAHTALSLASVSWWPCMAHFAFSTGEISDGLISLRPPQNTLVYRTGMPASWRCWSIAALCSSTSCLSVPWATAMML